MLKEILAEGFVEHSSSRKAERKLKWQSDLPAYADAQTIKKMNMAIENDFESLDVTMPCCGKSSSLNDLKYHFPCGFACAEFVVENPEGELGNENIIELEKILDTKLRVIHCHM